MSNEEKQPETQEPKAQETQTQQPEQSNSPIYLYIAIGCFAFACLLFALAFAIKGAGVYLLISSMVSSLAAASFINAQKRRAPDVKTTLRKVFVVLNYAIMIAALAVVIIGMSVTAATK